MQKKNQSELSVITKAKDLANYVLTVTEKSPKRFRFTLVSRLQNYSLDIIEELYRANDIFLKQVEHASAERRIEHQRQAMTDCRLLAYVAQLAMEQQCILPKQYEQITKKIYDVQNMLGAWMKSDARRTGI